MAASAGVLRVRPCVSLKAVKAVSVLESRFYQCEPWKQLTDLGAGGSEKPSSNVYCKYVDLIVSFQNWESGNWTRSASSFVLDR